MALVGVDLIGAGAGVVVFGLASAVAFGLGDFGGGWTSRRAPVLGVSLIVQAIGATLMIAAAVGSGERPLERTPFVLAAIAGATGVFGIVNLYHGLAVGRMGVVAPVTGVLAASVPVGVGVVLEGPPPPIVSAGIALAFVAVILVSRAPGAEGRRSGIEFGIAAGLGIGAFNVFLGLIPEGHVFWPLAVLKLSAALIIVAVVLFGRRSWRVPRSVLPAAIAVAIADMAGNGLFLLAAQAGELAVASVLSSLYPVTTVLLAATVLREPITRGHAVGIAIAVLAIVCIGSGSISSVG
ncbi:MAG TPA: DMT family transporter [Candidatus Limnocylindrales bacterium]|nr:DMT family transporter [Candidatus Limnocylindrales bacterium]